MELKFCKNIAENEYELILHGEVGEEINGANVAREINYLNQIGAKSIKERINTIGGTVVDAFSIVSANLASKAVIKTVNEGVADSAGGFILASGDNGFRESLDYATMLIHDVSVDGVFIEDLPEGKTKNEVSLMRDSIVTILSNNSNKSPEEILSIMKESKRLTAKEAKEMGFIDNIISSIKKPKINLNLNSLQVMNICKDFHNEKLDMKQVLHYLNLNADASENSALSAIQAIDNKAKAADVKVEALNKTVTELENKSVEKDAKISELNTKIVVFEKAQNKAAVDSAISSGKFSEENREALETQINNIGIEAFNGMIDMMKLQRVDLTGKVVNKSTAVSKETDKDLATKFQNMSETEKRELKSENKVEFDKMLNAWNEN